MWADNKTFGVLVENQKTDKEPILYHTEQVQIGLPNQTATHWASLNFAHSNAMISFIILFNSWLAHDNNCGMKYPGDIFTRNNTPSGNIRHLTKF